MLFHKVIQPTVMIALRDAAASNLSSVKYPVQVVEMSVDNAAVYIDTGYDVLKRRFLAVFILPVVDGSPFPYIAEVYKNIRLNNLNSAQCASPGRLIV